MLRIDTQSRPPVRVELPGAAHIDFKPLATPGLMAGRSLAHDVREAGEGATVAGVAFTIAVARWGAVAWEGIEDEGGKPLALTPDNVQLLLEQSEDAFTAVQLGYVSPALDREAEKNGSAPARVGTSRAQRKTSPKAKGRSAASDTAKAASAPTRKSAPTKPTARKRS